MSEPNPRPGAIVYDEDLDAAVDELLALGRQRGESLRTSQAGPAGGPSPEKPDIGQLLSEELKSALNADISRYDDKELLERAWSELATWDADVAVKQEVIKDLRDAEQQLRDHVVLAHEGRRRLRSFVLNKRLQEHKPKAQAVPGNQNVQIQEVLGSTIRITYGEQAPRDVPLEQAVVPVSRDTRSPARLVQARSGVVPYTAREGLLGELEAWIGVTDPFAGCIIGGRGGSGKTRLAVELCERVNAKGWLSGLLSPIANPAALESLVNAPTARLIVVDYAELRVEQLEVLLPLLAAGATHEQPVRVLLLVRAGPRRTADWAERLRSRSDKLDALLDECDVRVLEHMPLEIAERRALFSAAADAFAVRADAPKVPPDTLDQTIFSSPLMVVIAAYLSVHGNAAVPSTRTALLDEALAHEQRYWHASMTSLVSDDMLHQRVVALATLVRADNEAAAVETLRLLPDLTDATEEYRQHVARWMHELYPGPRWWNPLEPDPLGERLVANVLADQPAVLTGVLAQDQPQALIQPLEVYARAAADDSQLEAALQPILSRELARLCEVAVAQAATATDRDLVYGNTTTAAAAINRAIAAIKVDPSALSVALAVMPLRPDLILNSLMITLSSQLVEHLRPLVAADPDAYEPNLALSLNTLSLRLGEAGRRGEGLIAIEEAVEIHRRLAAASPAAYEPRLADSLNNLSIRLGEVGRGGEGLAAIEEAVEIYRRLAAASPAADEPNLAILLNSLSIRLGEVGRGGEGLAAIEEAVEIYRRLAAANPAAYEPNLALGLNNLAIGLGEAARREEALAASEEAVDVYRRVAAANPAAYEPDLAQSLSILSSYLDAAGRHDEAGRTRQELADLSVRPRGPTESYGDR